MTAQASRRDKGSGGESPIHVILATHSREVQTALFHSLNTLSRVTIVATGMSTAELVNYTHAFAPEVIIVEAGLPGLPMSDVLIELGTVLPQPRMLFIGEYTDLVPHRELPPIEVFADLEQLIAAIPAEGADSP